MWNAVKMAWLGYESRMCAVMGVRVAYVSMSTDERRVTWEQRSAANKGKLSGEQLARLKAIGFVFDGTEARRIRELAELPSVVGHPGARVTAT